MGSSTIGYLFRAGYIVLVGAATFLVKFTMDTLSPYQINFLMSLGMIATALPALWLTQGSLTVPTRSLPLGAPIGLMMALGSICFVLALSYLPVGSATAISSSYVALVAVLSWIFLDEEMTPATLAGIALTVAGVALLGWKAK